MLNILKSSARDTVIYSIGTFASKLAGLILVRLYTNEKFLSSEDFGVLNLSEANLQIIVSVFGLGLCYSLERWYWDKEHLHKRKSLFFSILVASTCISFLLITLFFIFSTTISSLLFDSANYADIVRLLIICASLEIISQTTNSLVRLKEKPGLFTVANLTKLILSLVVTSLCLIKFNLGLASVYYGQLVGIFGYFLILSKILWQEIEFKLNTRELWNMIHFRFPFLLPVIALNVFNFNDRFLLSNMMGMTEAGIYSLGAKLANTIKVFLITAIWLALMPTVYKMMDHPQNKRFYSKLMTYLGMAVIIFVMLFSFFSKEIVMLFAKDKIYYEAYKIVPIVALGLYFSLLKDISMIGLNITKKTRAIATVTLVITAANLLLNIILIPYLGIYGAALAGLLAQLFFFIIIHWIAQQQYPIPYELRKIFTMIVLACLLYLITIPVQQLNIWLSAAIKLSLILIFPFLLLLTGFYEKIELERLKGLWKKWRSPSSWLRNLKELVH